MKLTCNKNELQKLVTLAEKSSSKNPTLPILSTIKLKTLQNKLSLISTNLEVGFEATIPAKIISEGEVAVAPRVILSLLSSINDDIINLEKNNNNLKIISKNSSSNVKCFPSEDFPILPKIKKETYFIIDSSLLIKALKNIISSAALSFSKPELASVYFFSENKLPLTFSATDSFRLSEYKTEITPKPFSLLIPQKNAQDAIRIFEDVNENIEVVFNKNQISFQSKNIYFISRLTEGKFPDYQGIIPKSFLTQVVVDKNQVINSIKAASIFSSRLSEVLLGANPAEGILEIKASYSDTGEHRSVSVAKISGDPFEASFNFHYILDALHSIPATKVFLGFNGASKAMLLKGFEDINYFHLIMPMRGS